MRAGIEPRAPPGLHHVKVTAEFRSLILKAYSGPIGTDMLLNIEIHLNLLNSQDRGMEAIAFLKDCEIGAKAEVQKRSKEKSRNVLKLIGTSTVTASLGLAVKYICAKIGIS
jgi:hypothetical protein